MSPALPPEIERFLIAHVDSIAQLEILHLLQDAPAAEHTAAAIARTLGVDAAWAAAELENLANLGFVVPSPNGAAPAFRYAPRTSELADTLEQVLRAFRERRVTVIDFVASKPSRHIRGFADAFRLRKD
jgi:hypothetical protein